MKRAILFSLTVLISSGCVSSIMGMNQLLDTKKDQPTIAARLLQLLSNALEEPIKKSIWTNKVICAKNNNQISSESPDISEQMKEAKFPDISEQLKKEVQKKYKIKAFNVLNLSVYPSKEILIINSIINNKSHILLFKFNHDSEKWVIIHEFPNTLYAKLAKNGKIIITYTHDEAGRKYTFTNTKTQKSWFKKTQYDFMCFDENGTKSIEKDTTSAGWFYTDTYTRTLITPEMEKIIDLFDTYGNLTLTDLAQLDGILPNPVTEIDKLTPEIISQLPDRIKSIVQPIQLPRASFNDYWKKFWNNKILRTSLLLIAAPAAFALYNYYLKKK